MNVWRCRFLFGFCFLCQSLLFCSGCDSKPKPAAAENRAANEKTLPITIERVGEYLIGKSTLQEVFGEDSPVARQRLTERGLNCEFSEDGLLSAVTITSADYALANGLGVGSNATDVRALLGPPLETSFQSGQLKFEALVYVGFTFLLDDSGSVYAIRVGK